MIRKALVVVSLLSALFLLMMLQLTTPAEIGPLGVLVFFTLVYLLSLGVSVWLVRLTFILLGTQNKAGSRDIQYGSIIAFAPVMMLVVRSFEDNFVLKLLLILAFIVLGCFLVSRKA
jgi:hypothetical protein